MTEHAPSSSDAAQVACPFVAFVDDRDRRAHTPDRRNHCYAETVPRPRALAYQADFCLAPAFARCDVFLAWASRAAASPAESGGQPGVAVAVAPGGATGDVGQLASPARDPVWLFDMPRDTPRGAPDTDEWVPTTAWLGLTEEDAEATAAPPGSGPPATAPASAAAPGADLPDDGPLVVEPDPAGQAQETPSPIPAARLAALPLRRRRAPVRPLRPIGSGEWEEGAPLIRESLVQRRFADARVGLLLGLVVVLLLGAAFIGLSGLSGGSPGGTPDRDQPGAIAGASDDPASLPSGAPGSADPGSGPAASPTAPTLVGPSPSTSPEPGPSPRTYRVRSGDTLSRIASRFKVTIELLQCVNRIRDPNVLSVGQELIIPRRGTKCPAEATASPPPG